LMDDPSTASVYFLRPEQGFMGVRGKPVGIDLDGENLLDLSVGHYTCLRLKPGTYDMKVTSWTIEGENNAMVETSRQFILDLTPADSVYLLFTLEKFDFWETLEQRLPEVFFTGIVHIGEHLTLTFEPQATRRPGIGYQVEPVSRERALEAASKLTLVEDAQ
jgi:hypothetical protein